MEGILGRGLRKRYSPRLNDEATFLQAAAFVDKTGEIDVLIATIRHAMEQKKT